MQSQSDKERSHQHDQNTFNSVNQYFQNIQNYDVVNDVNSALAVDLSSLNHAHDDVEGYTVHIDPSIAHENTGTRTVDVATTALQLQGGKTSDSRYEDVNLPEGFDPKRVCRFCGKTFSHVGSLGRHLDQKKGTDGHPAEQIDIMRSDVRRRGDPESVRRKRLLRSQRYNRREDVKERNRIRRRKKSKEYRAKELAVKDFIATLNVPTMSQHPSFPRMVLYFLPPSHWPHDPPTLQTYKTVNVWIQQEVDGTLENHAEKLKSAYGNWTTLSGSAKHEMWIREQRICAQEALGSLSLFQLATRDDWIAKMATKKLAMINAGHEMAQDVMSGSDEKEENEDNEDGNDSRFYHNPDDVNSEADQDATSEALAAVAAAVASQTSRD
ncbi:unnamed protein product [Kuraishia capsulata CBS 1993]|uniref:C2H2-type domain-containing protein n=1 Tax=Kuraishia capsulata CBS 1993 TaxID=1382522 RepID=W6MIB0_9ASCO|nr:uncharacterized protein KUCA_T00000027001 [Kuraishia capsulata CBS 1993]CDK24067.1 unnamed protein product [Kuraishia capsulata CBS 1993]